MNIPLHLINISLSHEQIALYAPDQDFVRKAYQDGSIAFPYWSQVWPAAIGLTEFILKHPEYIQHRNVLELGAGLGLPSIIASRTANTVTSSDKEPDALDAIHHSIQHHSLSNCNTALIDWNEDFEQKKFDVLLLSDINYEPDQFKRLGQVMEQFLKNDGLILLATPQRLMARDFIASLQPCMQEHCTFSVRQGGTETLISILVLEA